MSEVLISIVIPVYNVEKYIEQCIESVLNQTFSNFEIIIINDGSKDNTLSICRELEKRDNRIRVINKNNEGVSVARNLGIKISKGKYIMFVDSDDYVEENWISNLYNIIKDNDQSIVMCGFNKHNLRGRNNCIQYVGADTNHEEIYLDKKDFYFTYEKNLINYVWNKIYVKEILDDNDIKFDENISLGEDLLFNLKYMEYVKNIIIINNPLYNYMLRDAESLDHKYYPNLLEIYKLLYSELYNYFIIFNSNLAKYETAYYKSYYNMLRRTLSNTFNKKNKSSFFEKVNLNSKILSSSDFIKCLDILGKRNFNIVYYYVLRSKNFYLYSIYCFALKAYRKIRNLL